ncbi:uncharacterized protein LTHEOB_4507 [Lasiodiplodia theobromae]|uniref:uncharacterized protein n=1 Tax=Lasiodiplodia theobromae TaxID=45133 RepID=UPI0015C31503|nr:uncharacterized protein LTHEOB_4507 [Lasiodiplodia theobromae]KAF4545855.1 hypothetical protein LTHEOB_4507 [Lasiodiplodia theobromae]
MSSPDEDTYTSSPRNWHEQGRRLQRACVDFEEALLSLRNIRQLRVCIKGRESGHFLHWRGYVFDVSYATCFGLDWDMAIAEEIAPLAFILRILGKRNSSSDSLTSIRMHLNGDKWWGLQDIDYAWTAPNADEYEDEDEGMETFGGRSESIIQKNCHMAEKAFIHLTDIRIGFGLQDDNHVFLEALGRCLEKAKKLDRLDLSAFGHDVLWNVAHFDMLTKINNFARWPMIRHLNLDSVQFMEGSILRMLSLVAPTLEKLSLKNCLLLDNPDSDDDWDENLDEKSSWSKVYDKMRLISFRALYDLNFKWCYQKTVHTDLLESSDWSPPENEDISGQVKHIMVDSVGVHLVIGYSSDIYDYILKRTETKPPLRFFRALDSDVVSLGILDHDWIWN